MEHGSSNLHDRALSVLVSILTGLFLPISGAILHACSHNNLISARHIWLALHAAAGVLFVFFAGWHAFMNRRQLLRYLKPGTLHLRSTSLRARVVIAILALLFLVIIVH